MTTSHVLYAVLDPLARRRLANLYASPKSGLLTAVPDYLRITADQIAAARTAAAVGTATIEQWRATDSRAHFRTAAAATRSLTLTWSAGAGSVPAQSTTFWTESRRPRASTPCVTPHPSQPRSPTVP